MGPGAQQGGSMTTGQTVKQQFEAYILGLAEYFAAESAAHSVTHQRWGTIDRQTALRIAAQIAR